MSPDLRPMDLGELLDRSIRLFRQAWRPMLLLGLVAILPTLLYNLLVPATPNPSGTQFLLSIVTQQAREDGPFARLLHFVANGLVTLLVDGTVILITTELLLGRAVDLGTTIRTVLRHYGNLLGTSLLEGLAYGAAAIGMVVAGLIVPLRILILPLGFIGLLWIALLFTFPAQVVMSEAWEGSAHALKRSMTLVKGRFWPIAGFTLLFGLGNLLLDVCLRLFLNLPLTLLPVEMAMALRGILDALPRVLTGPFSIMVLTLLYFDTRIRQEGFDLTRSQEA